MDLLSISIVFENSDFVVINKPTPLLAHRLPQGMTNYKLQITNEPVLTDWIVNRYPQTKSIIDPVSGEQKCGLVHRLDKETSGIMIIAKTQTAFNELKQLFQTHTIEKTYHALLIGQLPKTSGEINLPIAKAKQGTKRTSHVQQNQRRREARTDYRILHVYTDPIVIPEQILSYAELSPKTGRTHQIRVHCAAIGHPVVGDYLYGGKTSRQYRQILGRTFLHAYSLAFVFSGTKFHFETELPDELTGFLKKLHPVK